LIQHHGGSKIDPKRQDGPYAHSIIVSPDKRFAYAGKIARAEAEIAWAEAGLRLLDSLDSLDSPDSD